jgi:hypothetical protein
MIKAITGASRESTEACEGKTKALPETTKACPEVTPACLEEEKEQTPKETEVVAEQQEVPKGATEDRTGEQCLAVRHHRQRKKRAQVNGGPRQKFAAAHRRFTHHAIPAMLKGHVRKGPRRNRRSGVRGPGKTFRSKMEGRSLKQRQIRGNVARETPEGWTDKKRRRTRPECNSGIRRLSKTTGNGKRGRTEKRRLERMEADREIIRRSLRLEIAKLMIMSFIGLRDIVEVSAPTEAEEVVPQRSLEEQPRSATQAAAVRSESPPETKEEKIDNWCRLLGTSSLKEGAV